MVDIETMENIPDFYILGLPLEPQTGTLENPIVSLGIMYPIKVKQYLKFAIYTQVLNIQDFEFKKMLNPNNEIYEYIKGIHFFYAIKMFGEADQSDDNIFYQMYKHYKDLFKVCFHADVFDLIETSEDFEYYRELIREFNGIQFEPPNPNPEIERFNRLKKLLESRKGDAITFKAMYTSILVATGNNPNDLTLYQFHEIFSRIGHFKSYDTTTLYKTVDSSGKLEVQPWYGETKEKQPSTISEEQVNSARELRDKGGLQKDL